MLTELHKKELKALPEHVLNLIEEFAVRSEKILAENLTGVYLHGSAVMECFNPQKSDLDFIIVVNEKLLDETKLCFMDMVLELNAKAPKKGIEMSIVLKNECRPFVYPTPFELHFSSMHEKWFKENPEDYIKKNEWKRQRPCSTFYSHTKTRTVPVRRTY